MDKLHRYIIRHESYITGPTGQKNKTGPTGHTTNRTSGSNKVPPGQK